MKQSLIIVSAFIIGSITGSSITYMTTIGGVKSQGDFVAKAIDNPTTSVENTFETNIKKLKNKNGSLKIETKPEIESTIEEAEKVVEKRRGLFRRGKE